jgi:hypothetical protein
MGGRATSALGVAGALLMGAAATFMPAPASATPPDVVVAVIDTGVRATHQEFDYGGPSDTTDQFVAWWDFSSDSGGHLPAAGQTWDTTFADPYDGHGHGTATAAAAVGLNHPGKTPSFAPGAKLAVAKVGNAAAGLSNIDKAIKWARDTVQADVISMSIGQAVPAPASLGERVYEQIELARQAGILVVLSNGNGWANAGVPGEPGFATGYANSPYALGVGAVSVDGLLVTTDPEVVSTFKQQVASHACDTCYTSKTGTSFSAPRVAGFAAHLKQTALANGQAPTAGYLETLVKYSARNTVTPPSHEGYGVVDGAQLAGADAHAAAGTLPARPSPDVDALYVETVQGTLDGLWQETAIIPWINISLG